MNIRTRPRIVVKFTDVYAPILRGSSILLIAWQVLRNAIVTKKTDTELDAGRQFYMDLLFVESINEMQRKIVFVSGLKFGPEEGGDKLVIRRHKKMVAWFWMKYVNKVYYE